MSLLRLAAFATETGGGNPAGVHLSDTLPTSARMQAIAAKVGYSETAFAAPEGDSWRMRYYSQLAEVAFCGHATIFAGPHLQQAALSISGKAKIWARRLTLP